MTTRPTDPAARSTEYHVSAGTTAQHPSASSVTSPSTATFAVPVCWYSHVSCFHRTAPSWLPPPPHTSTLNSLSGWSSLKSGSAAPASSSALWAATKSANGNGSGTVVSVSWCHGRSASATTLSPGTSEAASGDALKSLTTGTRSRPRSPQWKYRSHSTLSGDSKSVYHLRPSFSSAARDRSITSPNDPASGRCGECGIRDGSRKT
mmetsp:Transcript_3074/g.7331  ORF Transcript_3074/g.7331 Transcript_3074/m.7331 type:complete len:206 (-) Transcript_3074:333-950(-)